MFDRSVRQSAWHSDGIIVSARGACAFADGTAVSVPVPLSPVRSTAATTTTAAATATTGRAGRHSLARWALNISCC